jgi:hypothetical protein
VSYDLVVWRGPRPNDAVEAARFYEAHMRAVEDGEAPPSRAIQSFLDEVTDRIPAERDPLVGSAWAGSAWDDAVGDVAILTFRPDRAGVVLDVCGRVAAEHGLVCYDPQTGSLVR